MVEYIDKGKLIDRLNESNCVNCNSSHGLKCDECVIDSVRNSIVTIPCEKVVKIKHGTWVYDDISKKYICTNCDTAIWTKTDWNKTKPEFKNFCPHCGAKMDTETIQKIRLEVSI